MKIETKTVTIAALTLIMTVLVGGTSEARKRTRPSPTPSPSATPMSSPSPSPVTSAGSFNYTCHDLNGDAGETDFVTVFSDATKITVFGQTLPKTGVKTYNFGYSNIYSGTLTLNGFSYMATWEVPSPALTGTSPIEMNNGIILNCSTAPGF